MPEFEFDCPLAFRGTRLLAGQAVSLTHLGQRVRLEVPGQSYALYSLMN